MSNADGDLCTSPLVITAKDVSLASTVHNVAVTFTDVCGRSRTAEFNYTQTGVVAVTPTELLAADGTIIINSPAGTTTTTTTTRPKNAVAGLHASGAIASAAAGVAALLLALA